MKNNIPALLIIAIWPLAVGGQVKADQYDETVDKFAIAFNGGDGTGQVYAAMDFSGAVPAKDRAEVIARILDKILAQKSPDRMALSGACITIDTLKVPSNDHLRRTIDALSTNPNSSARSCGLSLMAKEEKDAKRDAILAFQNDPDDDLRAQFMNEISLWPDAGTIYEKYIQEHEGDTDYKKSLKVAKDCSDLNRRYLKSVNK